MARTPKYLISNAMKNEGPYVLEWIAHYLSIGVGHFLIVSNDCDDNTDRILDRMNELGHVTHVPNPKPLMRGKGNWQVLALRYARMFNVYRDATWIMNCDADELLQINTGDGTLDAYFAAAGDTDVVSFTSVPYNSNGVKEIVDTPVAAQFTEMNKAYSLADRSDLEVAQDRRFLNAVKSIYRNAVRFDLRRNHRPLRADFSTSGHIWRDGSGQVIEAAFTDGKSKARSAIVTTDLAQLNHYAIRSAAAFLVKVDRGDAAGTDRLDHAVKYWTNYNTPGDTDTRYATQTPQSREIYEDFLADPELGPLHHEAVAIHQAKAARILETPEGRKLAEMIGYFD